MNYEKRDKKITTILSACMISFLATAIISAVLFEGRYFGELGISGELEIFGATVSIDYLLFLLPFIGFACAMILLGARNAGDPWEPDSWMGYKMRVLKSVMEDPLWVIFELNRKFDKEDVDWLVRNLVQGNDEALLCPPRQREGVMQYYREMTTRGSLQGRGNQSEGVKVDKRNFVLLIACVLGFPALVFISVKLLEIMDLGEVEISGTTVPAYFLFIPTVFIALMGTMTLCMSRITKAIKAADDWRR